ncbi:glycine--tRNA ligase [Candidatus Dojkabacteria bacterium]|uniref:glycine--tRNA ligase n=1 Tax=Candidatus Dojkabacteria bacterium TaxID=2099670 RepID=A0A955I9Y4_9BACT|nr:glycine--tRNA ligase [Candidatus Dojkabacteria bacterium]
MINDNKLENVVAMSKRRGFIFPSSEIYGGLANTYDFGPYGTMLKENIRQLWIKKFINDNDNIHQIDSSVIINPAVWEASGHVSNFADVMVEDVENKKRYRADHIIEEHFEKKGEELKVDGKSAEELDNIIKSEGIKSPDGNNFTDAKKYNTLFETEIGIISGSKNKAYLRGEIAQGIFMNYKNIIDSIHPKLPFGIAQTGKAFRNEITAGKFTFRTLEFDLMEFEYFFDNNKDDWNELFEYWKSQIEEFVLSIGIKRESFRWRAHEEFELSHYSSRTEDLEYIFPWGPKELFAVAYRSDFDLKNHQEKSGKNLEFVYPDGSKKIPHVIEPTFGLSRAITVILMDAYHEEEIEDENGPTGRSRVVLKLAKNLAPIKLSIFPLQKDEKIQSLAKEIYKDIKEKFSTEYQDSGNIGKMYRKQDEIGTPYCVTVDYETIEDRKVTVRDRDTMKQERVEIDKLEEYISKGLKQ